MDNKQVIFKIQYQLLFLVLPLAITPLIIVVIFVSNRVFNHLEYQNNQFYSTVLNQVAYNVDFVYEQYARTLSNMIEIPEVIAGLESPPYKSEQQEKEIHLSITGDSTTKGGLRNTVEEKIEGAVAIIELDRKSLLTNTDYKIHYISDGSKSLNLDNLLEDPLFLKIRSENQIKMILGKPKPGVLSGFDADKRPMIIFPYYSEPPASPSVKFNKFVVVILFSDFVPQFYSEITNIDYGTIYILDRIGSVLIQNHPGDNDYYDFDEDIDQYILNGDDPNDPDEIMTFNEYQNLNTDQSILDNPRVLEMINNLTRPLEEIWDEEDDNRPVIISFQNIKYMVISAFAPASETKFVYFHPLSQIRKPVYSILYLILIITMIVIALVFVISLIASRNFTNPIKNLSSAAQKIADGDYELQIKTNTNNEIGLLSKSFNHMVNEIKNKTDSLENANIRLTQLDTLKTLFLNSVSHNLRTPLNQVSGNVNAMLMDTLDHIDSIESCNKEMMEEVQDKLDKPCMKELFDFLKKFQVEIIDNDLSFFDYFFLSLKSYVFKIPAKEREAIIPLMNNIADTYNEYENKRIEYLKKSNMAVSDLVTIIESVSDISDIEASTTGVTVSKINIREFVNEIGIQVPPLLEKYKKNELSYTSDVSDELSIFVYIDPKKIKNVLMQLLNNAVKFSTSGNIKLEVKKETLQNSENIVFIVTDQGIGIKEEDLQMIFTEFTRCDEVYKIEGSGLGLSLAKKIVDLCNGQITVVSTHGQGSEFTVTLPLQAKEKFEHE
jgi:signal transduction histidine kinase